jgi:hypothetical protein
MSDGGKGSAPRPFSVTQQEYDNRWDHIFGRDKNKPADFQDVLSTEDCVLGALDGNYDCHRCYKENNALVNKMILCPECGNKRCPRASDHRLDCTGSNEPGQPGSVY